MIMSVDLSVVRLLLIGGQTVKPFGAQIWHRGNFGRGAGQNDTGGVQRPFGGASQYGLKGPFGRFGMKEVF